MDHLCYLCLVSCVCHVSRLFIAAFRSPAGKGLTSWLSFVIFNCVFVTFPCGILCQVWYRFLIFATFLTLKSSSLMSITVRCLLPNLDKGKINTAVFTG